MVGVFWFFFHMNRVLIGDIPQGHYSSVEILYLCFNLTWVDPMSASFRDDEVGWKCFEDSQMRSWKLQSFRPLMSEDVDNPSTGGL